jgi:uncharacterized protein YkwD
MKIPFSSLLFLSVFLSGSILYTSYAFFIFPEKIYGEEKEKISSLSPLGIFLYTNKERHKENLPFLSYNETLALIAQEKAEDMLKKDYFSHTSPEGKEVKDGAKEKKYSFLAVGENLAFGPFSSNESLVLKWMESPSHRSAILDRGFTEIGIGLVRVPEKNPPVYFAVQVFGLPSSVCPHPENALKKEIEMRNALLSFFLPFIEEKERKYKEEREKSLFLTYEKSALLYNSFIKTQKEKIKEYNTQVVSFYECTKKYGLQKEE